MYALTEKAKCWNKLTSLAICLLYSSSTELVERWLVVVVYRSNE